MQHTDVQNIFLFVLWAHLFLNARNKPFQNCLFIKMCEP